MMSGAREAMRWALDYSWLVSGGEPASSGSRGNYVGSRWPGCGYAGMRLSPRGGLEPSKKSAARVCSE
jgi:hypothetical protein